MTEEVKKRLTSVLDIPDDEGGGDQSCDKVSFCKYLRKKKKHYQPVYIDVLMIVLKAFGKYPASQIADRFFKLYKEGKLSTQTTKKEKKGIYIIDTCY